MQLTTLLFWGVCWQTHFKAIWSYSFYYAYNKGCNTCILELSVFDSVALLYNFARPLCDNARVFRRLVGELDWSTPVGAKYVFFSLCWHSSSFIQHETKLTAVTVIYFLQLKIKLMEMSAEHTGFLRQKRIRTMNAAWYTGIVSALRKILLASFKTIATLYTHFRSRAQNYAVRYNHDLRTCIY